MEFDLDETLADLDEYAFQTALQWVDELKLDFWHGAFGVLFYLIERLSNPRHRQWAETLMSKICAQVRGDNNGLWLPNISDPKDESVINFSLSHGQTAFLLVLMQAAKKGVEAELARSVVRRGINLILSYQRSTDYEENFSYFPFWVNDDTQEQYINNRMAVCYGDLNIVLLFYKAAAFLENDDLRRKADLIGLNTLRRQSEKATLVSDSHFCHGAAGVAQLYHSLYRIAGHEGYYKGYQYWIDRTVAALHHDLQNDAFGDNPGGLVTGQVGVALVLLTYIYHQNERLLWEKIFLMNP
ncbi:MAG: hypothetical protein MUE30_14755 [Spirosomaceae bacterium]|nr:hypothetical protein [Spirosomataceae bacterium]